MWRVFELDCYALLGHMRKWIKGGERKSEPKLGSSTLERRGSRQKHIIEGRSSVNEGSMHHSPQLLTLTWLTAKTIYIVLTRFSTLEYDFCIFPWLRCTKTCMLFPYALVLIPSATYQAALYGLFKHARRAALLHHGDLWDKRVWQPSFTRTYRANSEMSPGLL